MFEFLRALKSQMSIASLVAVLVFSGAVGVILTRDPNWKASSDILTAHVADSLRPALPAHLRDVSLAERYYSEAMRLRGLTRCVAHLVQGLRPRIQVDCIGDTASEALSITSQGAEIVASELDTDLIPARNLGHLRRSRFVFEADAALRALAQLRERSDAYEMDISYLDEEAHLQSIVSSAKLSLSELALIEAEIVPPQILGPPRIVVSPRPLRQWVFICFLSACAVAFFAAVLLAFFSVSEGPRKVG